MAAIHFYLPPISGSNCLGIMILVTKDVLSRMGNPVISVLTWQCPLKQNSSHYLKWLPPISAFSVSKWPSMLEFCLKLQNMIFLWIPLLFWSSWLHWMLHCACRLANKDHVHLSYLEWCEFTATSKPTFIHLRTMVLCLRTYQLCQVDPSSFAWHEFPKIQST